MIKFKLNKRIKDGSLINHRGLRDKIVFGIVAIIFAVYAISLLYPLAWMVLNSFKPKLQYINDLKNGTPFAFPNKFMLINYVNAFTHMKDPNSGTMFFGMIINSAWITILTVGEGIFASAIMGYCISKYKFKVCKVIYAVIIFTMTIPIVGSTGASFKLMSDLGIYNSPMFVILISFCGYGFNFLIMYGFFKNISWSYAEAVFMDGGGHFTVFFRIMLPQGKAAMVTLAIMAFIGCWNDYMTPLLYLPNYPTVASGLYNISKTLKRVGDIPVYYAGLVISMLPILILFGSCSELIMKNVAMGGLKG